MSQFSIDHPSSLAPTHSTSASKICAIHVPDVSMSRSKQAYILDKGQMQIECPECHDVPKQTGIYFQQETDKNLLSRMSQCPEASKRIFSAKETNEKLLSPMSQDE